MKVMYKYDQCCKVTAYYTQNILQESSKQRLNHFHPDFFHSSYFYLSFFLSCPLSFSTFYHSTRCIEMMYNIRCIVYDVPEIVLGTTNPEIQRLVGSYLCFVGSSVSLVTQLLYSEKSGVCAGYPEKVYDVGSKGRYQVSTLGISSMKYSLSHKYQYILNLFSKPLQNQKLYQILGIWT